MANTLSMVGISSIVMIFVVLLIYFARKWIISQNTFRYQPTWGCGYAVPNAKMQYTGKSFSKTLAKLFYFITAEKKKYREIESNTIFPVSRKHSSHYPEFFEINIINRLRNGLLGFMNYFTFIQSGKIQMYILYGLLFIVVLIVSTYFNFIN
jgi:hypothetical protein